MSKWNFIKDIYDEVEFFVKRIEDFYYNIKNGIHNFIVWRQPYGKIDSLTSIITIRSFIEN